jgi:hypothetical protein
MAKSLTVVRLRAGHRFSWTNRRLLHPQEGLMLQATKPIKRKAERQFTDEERFLDPAIIKERSAFLSAVSVTFHARLVAGVSASSRRSMASQKAR